jgi:hypothetical protein
MLHCICICYSSADKLRYITANPILQGMQLSILPTQGIMNGKEKIQQREKVSIQWSWDVPAYHDCRVLTFSWESIHWRRAFVSQQERHRSPSGLGVSSLQYTVILVVKDDRSPYFIQPVGTTLNYELGHFILHSPASFKQRMNPMAEMKADQFWLARSEVKLLCSVATWKYKASLSIPP